MIILFSFVLQAVSYEFQSKLGNLLGKRTYQWFLVINGIVGPLLLGGAVATFFTGSNFLVNKGNMGNELMPVISSWANGWHGLDALTNPWIWSWDSPYSSWPVFWVIFILSITSGIKT